MKKSIEFMLLTILATGPFLRASDVSLNVKEMSHLSQDSVGVLWDVWGWYDSQNERYYALATDSRERDGGMVVVDATNAENPILKGIAYNHSDTIRFANDIKVVGDYAYLACAANKFPDDSTSQPRIWIFYLPSTVLNPDTANPVTVMTFNDNDNGGTPGVVPLGDVETIYANDDYLFVNELNVTMDSLLEVAIYSLINPGSPTFLNIWNQYDFDPVVYGWPHSAYVEGTTAYLFNYYGGIYMVNFNGSCGQIVNWKKIWYDGARGDISDTAPGAHFRHFFPGQQTPSSAPLF